MRRLAIGIILTLLSRGAAAQEAGKADGTFTLDAQATPLTHAYARGVRNIPEMRLEGTPETQVIVMLVDRALSAEMAVSDMAVSQIGLGGGVRGIVLRFDPGTGAILSGRTVLPEAEMPQFFTNVSDPEVAAALTEGFKLADGRLAARAYSPRPNEVFHPEGSEGPKSWQFDVSFEAPVTPAPKLVATLEGKAAQDSEPAAALRRFIDAVVAGDVAGARAGVVSNHPGLATLTPEGMGQMREMLLGGAPDSAAVMAELKKIYIYEASAVALFQGEANGTSTLPLAKENGAWKLGAP
jgi:hypothetical protein